MVSAQAIVLHNIQHQSSTRIIRVLANSDEIIPLYVTGFGTGKGNRKAAIYYPGNVLEFTIKNPHKEGLKKVYNESIIDAHPETHRSIIKSAILTVSLECIFKLIPQEQRIEGLFKFYYHFLAYLNASDQYLNLPLIFLIRLSDFLGIQPEPGKGFFNIREGEFEFRQHATYGLDQELSSILDYCLKASTRDVISFELSTLNRKKLIDSYLQFIDYHIDGKHPILSIDILSEVMAD